jgi:hypothetical protein
VWFLELLAQIEPRAINPSIPTDGETPEDAGKNAKYAIAIARKLGAQVFCTHLDLVEANPKMVYLFLAALYGVSLQKLKEETEAQQ